LQQSAATHSRANGSWFMEELGLDILGQWPPRCGDGLCAPGWRRTAEKDRLAHLG